MKRFFASITLTLLHPDRLRGTIVLHPVEMQVETRDLLQTFGGFYKLSVS